MVLRADTYATLDAGGDVPADQLGNVGVATSLDDLADVNAPTPADQDVLSWDDVAGEWVPVAPGAAAHPNLAAHDTLGLATQAELDAHTTDTTDAHDASAVSFAPTGGIAATDVQAAIAELDSEKSGTAHTHTHAATTGQTPSDHHDPVTVGAGLDVTGQLVELDLSEVAAGGELGGFMDAPTVDATHSGSTHAGAASAAVTTHEADVTDVHAHSSLASITATDHHAAPVAGPDADDTIDAAGAAGTASTFARSGHGHKVTTDSGVASTQAFGDAATAGTSGTIQRQGHKHAMPADPVTAHEAAVDPHTGYRLESADHSHATTGLQAGTIAHSVTTGQTANDHHAESHASRHAENGADELLVEDLGTASVDTSKVFAPDGTGGVALVTPAGGGDIMLTDGTPAADKTIAAGWVGYVPDIDYEIPAGQTVEIAADGVLEIYGGPPGYLEVPSAGAGTVLARMRFTPASVAPGSAWRLILQLLDGSNNWPAFVFGENNGPVEESAWTSWPRLYAKAGNEFGNTDPTLVVDGGHSGDAAVDSDGASRPRVNVDLDVKGKVQENGVAIVGPGFVSAVPALARASAPLALTTAYQDITGATLTIVPTVAETWLVTAVFDFGSSVAGTGYCLGQLMLDGVAQTATASLATFPVGMAATPAQTWLLSVSAASHTVKLQARKTVNDGTSTAQTGATITVVRYRT